jgi:hypothetical protein
MIKYKGKQIRFIQYMPAKPIKHGIKVFALCCAESGYVYGCWVYCGKENDSCTNVEKIERLLEQESDFIINSAGLQVLYTDNYCRSESLMEMMYSNYKSFVVGTMSMTKKKSRTNSDFAFHQLSGPARKKVNRGWMRWAQKKIVDNAGRMKYAVQCITWMDCKQIGVLHNWMVGPPGETKTFCYNQEMR